MEVSIFEGNKIINLEITFIGNIANHMPDFISWKENEKKKLKREVES